MKPANPTPKERRQSVRRQYIGVQLKIPYIVDERALDSSLSPGIDLVFSAFPIGWNFVPSISIFNMWPYLI